MQESCIMFRCLSDENKTKNHLILHLNNHSSLNRYTEHAGNTAESAQSPFERESCSYTIRKTAQHQHYDNKQVILHVNTTASSKQSVYSAEDSAGHFLLS